MAEGGEGDQGIRSKLGKFKGGLLARLARTSQEESPSQEGSPNEEDKIGEHVRRMLEREQTMWRGIKDLTQLHKRDIAEKPERPGHLKAGKKVL